jgi:hypothetical protein
MLPFMRGVQASKGNTMKTKFSAGIAVMFVFVAVCSGTTCIELQSTYLGDGWFRYRMKSLPEPFLLHVDIQGLYLGGASTSGQSDYVYGESPLDWQNEAASQFPGWRYQLPYPSQQRPYQREFFIQSTERTFRYATNATIFMTLELVSDWFSYWRGAGHFTPILGYVNLPCLYPCSPEQADDSPPDRLCVFKIVESDMTLDSLVVTNGLITGVTFSAEFNSTVLLEGSMDYSHWTNIGYIWGDKGVTTWTTNAPLNDLGRYFRIELVAMDEHVTNLPPLLASSPIATVGLKTSAATKADLAGSPFVICRPQGNDVAVQFVSEAGQKYAVQAMDVRSQVVVTQEMTGTGKLVEAHFEAATLPNPVFFSAKPLP